MDYNVIKSLMESGNGQALALHLQSHIDSLRDRVIDENLPPEQYKVNALARDLAVKELRKILTPLLTYKEVEIKKKVKDDIYYSHTPKKV